jgi:hypothetical protein
MAWIDCIGLHVKTRKYHHLIIVINSCVAAIFYSGVQIFMNHSPLTSEFYISRHSVLLEASLRLSGNCGNKFSAMKI